MSTAILPEQLVADEEVVCGLADELPVVVVREVWRALQVGQELLYHDQPFFTTEAFGGLGDRDVSLRIR